MAVPGVRRGVPLRVSLVVGTLVLVALGLVASGIAVTTTMQRTMMNRADRELIDAANGWANRPPAFETTRHRPPSLFFIRTTDDRGRVVIMLNDRARADPDLPFDNDVGGRPVTVRSSDGGTEWRAVSRHDALGGYTTVARDITDVRTTVRDLLWLQVAIGIAVLTVLGVAGYWLVHRSLRPLAEVEATAADIAAGHLDRRVPERDPRTEVGRLSLALNGMLAQIQRAVADSEKSAKAARTSEERMRRFITDASHELRTPLTTIRGYAELYRQGAATDTELVLGRIEGESTRMGQLVEDLLLLARLDAHRPMEQRLVDLLVLATDAVHDAKATAPERDVELEVFDGPGTPEVIGDELRLRQVLGNLVSNALGHTTAAVRVRVGTEGDDAVLEVIDRGPGMTKTDAERVFERFYRADSSRTRSSGGTGLGLSIVDALTAAHGGTVTVHTAPGAGCRFEVRLPRADMTDDDADVDEPESATPDAAASEPKIVRASRSESAQP
ncbi:HAMP domain-containing histidine kinase [Mycobacteroides abscessus subsp. abscessus]|nr:HAMP domain-containing histidine kinase [Mycobacteroides abscessus subsp. abscessus]